MRTKELDAFVIRARVRIFLIRCWFLRKESARHGQLYERSFSFSLQEALAACTNLVVKEAQLAEIRQEALRSAKLQVTVACGYTVIMVIIVGVFRVKSSRARSAVEG